MVYTSGSLPNGAMNEFLRWVSTPAAKDTYRRVGSEFATWQGHRITLVLGHRITLVLGHRITLVLTLPYLTLVPLPFQSCT